MSEDIPPDSGAQEASSTLTVTHAREESMREQLSARTPGLAPAFLDAVLEAVQSEKKVRIHEPCAKCGCQHVRYVNVPDAMERARALEIVMTQTEGRPGTASELSQTPPIVRRVGLAQS